MRHAVRFIVAALAVVALAVPLQAQIPTGTLTGNVSDGKAPLPGVTITVSSPNLQGTRTAVSSVNGDYIFTFLPPGEYKVVFELSGFQNVEAMIRMSASQTARVDAEMNPNLTEEVTVTGAYETISANSQVATTITKQLVDELPIGRTPAATLELTPGASTNGPSGNVTISGSQSYENLWLVNGVVVNENLRGQSLPLFIEDAIQETTTTTGGVSAEYGRFAGGVITTLTKSGGNEFSGSFRVNFTNPSWSALRPGEVDATDITNKIYEATVGGFVIQDKLWFFLAGRDTGDSVISRQTWKTNIPYDTVSSQQRYEGKATFSITPSHRLIGSYIKIDQTTDGDRFTSRIYDLRSLSNRQDPQELWAFNYNGVLADNFFVEAQYSKRDYVIGRGSGSKYTDVINGTLLLNRADGSARWWSPTFCGVCKDKQRNNEDYLAKGSWFLSTPTMGSHDLVFGADVFQDFILEENHQSGSDYRIYATNALLYPSAFPTDILPVFSSTGSRRTYFYYQPQLTPSVGSKMKTQSIFVNDRWRLNGNWAFNLGLRYDKNDGKDSAGSTVAKDSRISPRLGASWDVKGNGEWVVNASLARYVTGIQNGGNVGDSGSAAGLTGLYLYYGGPEINGNANSLVSTEEAMQLFFDWLASVGGAFEWAKNPANWRFTPEYPGLTPVILSSLDSPYADEYTIGVAKRLGTRGLVRADYIHRTFDSFYATTLDTHTGTVTDPSGTTIDRAVITNRSSGLERKYDGINLSGQYRYSDTLTVGGTYTWSQAIGNIVGETSNNGPITIDLTYPEYRQASWNMPRGWLGIDQRNRARVWASWDLLAFTHHKVNIGVIEYFDSGLPYSAAGAVDTAAYVTNPGYVGPQTEWTYYYSGRGAYRTDNITRTDLSATYSFMTRIAGANIEIYIKPEVNNLFNEKGVVNVDTTVWDATTDSSLEPFNPFTEKPVEGVNWRKGDNFGKAVAPTDYQTPRTFRFAVGIRF